QFTLAITDDSMFPPRCLCRQEIPLETCRSFLTPELVAQFEDKLIEHEMLDKTYCHEPACSKFVPPQSTHGDVATCVQCHAETCTRCKRGSHQGTDCPNNPEVQQVNLLAVQEGWKRCYRCRPFVE
ncbi:hypothetical protein B0T22DRAFT_348194, partial [Podospora appendiculata]